MQIESLVTIFSVVSAAASPIILTIINHRHEARIKEIDSQHAIRQSVELELKKSKLECFKNLLAYSGDFAASVDTEADIDARYSKMLSAIVEASLYCSHSTRMVLSEFKTNAENLYTSQNVGWVDNFNFSLGKLQNALCSELNGNNNI